MNKKIYPFVAFIALACLAVEAAGAGWTPDPNSITLTQIQPVLNMLVDFICWPIYLIISISSGIASLLLIIGGARYVAADDPGTRAELRRFMIGTIAGLVIVLLSISIINYVIDGLLPAVACTFIDAPLENINTVFCNLINILSAIGPWLCAIVVIYGGLRYLTSADDPGARKAAKTTLIAAFVGLIIVMLAIPIVNMVLGDALDLVECESSDSDVTEQIVTVLGNFLCILALIAPPICALVVTYGGLRYITSADDPGARDTAKTIIISALIGMILVMLAVPLVNVVLTNSFEQVTFDCSQGQAATEITRIMCNFICFLSYIAPAVCALVVIYGGLRYLVSGDDPGARRIARTIIISAFVGMILVFIAVPIVNVVLTSAFGQVGCNCSESESVKDVVRILCKFICLIASVSPAIAALVIIYGGLRYVTSAEDPGARSSAKTIIISAFVGLILVMISLAMVNIVVSGWAKDVQCGCFNIDPVAQINKVFCSLACTIQMIIPAVAALVIIYGGLKYVTSAEDPSARAAARGVVIHALVGLIIVIIAIQVVNVVIAGLVPTFKCDCAQVFGTIASLNTADPKLHITSVPDNPNDKCDHNGEIGGKCCRVGDTECHYVYVSGGNIHHGDSTGAKITGCNPPSGAGGKYTITLEDGNTMDPEADAKCTDNSGNPFCSSEADVVKYGPTYVYDATSGVCVNKCAEGQKCCQTADQSGKPGCIGTDTGNQVKLNSCSLDDYLTSYTCVSDKCQVQTTDCTYGCKDPYSCNTGASPDPGSLDLANPEIG
jgi:hypothetical protein